MRGIKENREKTGKEEVQKKTRQILTGRRNIEKKKKERKKELSERKEENI